MPHYNCGTFFLRNATEFATKACDDFFAWIADFDGDFSQDPEGGFNTLFTYFDAWIEHKQETLGRSFANNGEASTWEAFEPLIPCIYVGIIDRLLVNPTLLDYRHENPALHTAKTIRRPMRRVSWLDGNGDNHRDNMDKLLDWIRSPTEDCTSRRYPFMHSPYADVNEDDLDAYP